MPRMWMVFLDMEGEVMLLRSDFRALAGISFRPSCWKAPVQTPGEGGVLDVRKGDATAHLHDEYINLSRQSRVRFEIWGMEEKEAQRD